MRLTAKCRTELTHPVWIQIPVNNILRVQASIDGYDVLITPVVEEYPAWETPGQIPVRSFSIIEVIAVRDVPDPPPIIQTNAGRNLAQRASWFQQIEGDYRQALKHATDRFIQF